MTAWWPLRVCSGRWFAGWKTRQERSYFALKLPRGWWVIAPDVQLASDIDEKQVDYFRRVARHFEKDDRIILCNAEPHWIYAHIYGDSDSNINENNLAYLENKVLGRNVSVFVAGDLHHYRRHEAADGTQKITCGGGGAFLHPTSGPEVEKLIEGEGPSAIQAKALRRGVEPRTFVKKSAYPSEKICRRMCWKNLAFSRFNPKFGIVTGVLYHLTCWSALADLSKLGLSQWSQALETALRAVVTSPPAVFWVVAIVGGFWLFTDTHSTRYRIIAGLLHGLTHLGAAFVIGWGAAYFCDHCLHFAFTTWKQMFTSAVLILAGGFIAGSEIMGIYLLISLNVFNHHMNEAFSSLAC